MPRTITIREEAGFSHPEEAGEPHLDLQDGMVLVGIVCGEAAALVIWWPAALILASLLGFGFAYLIERVKAKERKS